MQNIQRERARWSKRGEEDERGELRTNSSSVYSAGRRMKQRMAEEEKAGELGGSNARTHTRTHSYSLLNGYLIRWESDHANPLFKGSENVKKEGEKRRGEQGPLVFLEELKSISIMNTGLSDRKSKRTARGRRTEGWADRGDEDRRALCRGIHLRGFFSASST